VPNLPFGHRGTLAAPLPPSLEFDVLFRRIAVAVTAASLILAGLAVPALAGPKAGPSAAHTKVAAKKAAVAERKAAKKAALAQRKAAKKAAIAAKKAAAKARRDARLAARRFVATGRVVGVEGSTVTVAVKGGNRKAWHRTDQTFTLADGARVQRNDAVVTLDDLQAGDRVSVHGKGTTGLAHKVIATGPVGEEQSGGGEELENGGGAEGGDTLETEAA